MPACIAEELGVTAGYSHLRYLYLLSFGTVSGFWVSVTSAKQNVPDPKGPWDVKF
jgi:hypothetical protein